MRVFLSYPEALSGVAHLAEAALAEQGLETWVASNRLQPGEDVRRSIEAAIDRADVILFVIGGDDPSPWVEMERQSALLASWRDESKALVTVALPHARVPPFLAHWYVLRLGTNKGKWPEQFSRLGQYLRSNPIAFDSSAAIRDWRERLSLLESDASAADQPISAPPKPQ